MFTSNFFFEILSDLIQAVPNHLAYESHKRVSLIRYRLDQVQQNLKKKDFSGWRPVIAFLYLFLFHSLLRLTFFLSQNKKKKRIIIIVISKTAWKCPVQFHDIFSIAGADISLLGRFLVITRLENPQKWPFMGKQDFSRSMLVWMTQLIFLSCILALDIILHLLWNFQLKTGESEECQVIWFGSSAWLHAG